MDLLFDIATKAWTFTGDPGYNQVRLVFKFRDDGCLPVLFDRMRFGYELAGVRIVYPTAPGAWFNSTDQDIITTTHAALDPNRAYTLKVMCENAGVITRAEHTFTTPASPMPAQWYVPRLVILRRLKQAGLETAALAVFAEDKWRYEYWSASLEVANDDTIVRAMLTRMGANPNAILAMEPTP